MQNIFNDGYQNVQAQIETRLADKKKEKNLTRHMGKKKRPVKGKKNTNLIEIVDGRDPVASASEDESESVSQKNRDSNSGALTMPVRESI